MNKFKKSLILLIMAFLIYGCYEPLEINTDNANIIGVPVKLAAPLMDGSFVLEFDSFFNAEKVGNNMIVYENGIAFFKYDTVFDFFDELSEFLTMDDVDFGNMTSFEQAFNLVVEMSDFEMEYKDTLTFNTIIGPHNVPVDTVLYINPQDTFMAKYGMNSIFTIPSDTLDFQLEVLNLGDPIDLNIPYEVYRVDIASGLINLYIDHGNFVDVIDDELSMTPSFNYQYRSIVPPLSVDTIISKTLSAPIFKNLPHLPEGVFIRANAKIASLKHVVTDLEFEQEFIAYTLDTAFVLDLIDYYYASDGAGLIELDVAAYLEIQSPKDTAFIPLPDTLYFGITIDDLVFEKVVFNYGLDTAMTGNQIIDFDVFSKLPDGLDVEGFRLSNPELKLKVQSNLGFSALFDIDSFMFTTNGIPELITDDGTARLEVPFPTDPDDVTVYVPVGKDSLHLDSTNSRLEDVRLLKVSGLLVSYNVVINPEDEAGMPGQHNFFYNYPDDKQEEMYDVNLSAEVIIPFEFKFKKLSFPTTIESPITANELDSMIYLSGEDSVSLIVKVLTKDFPFSAKAQFYFDEVNASGGLTHLDSLFSIAKDILPSSNDGVWDSTEWRLTIDDIKYESIKRADSLTIDISMSMDENEYFLLEEGKTVEIGYQFSIGKSSFVIKQD